MIIIEKEPYKCGRYSKNDGAFFKLWIAIVEDISDYSRVANNA